MTARRDEAITPTGRASLLDTVGFPRGLGWGLVAVMVFLVGDGIEVTWISSYLVSSHGYSLSDSALVITAYGIVVAIGAFLSGALSEALGPRRVMALGLASFVVFDLLFITVGLASDSLPLLILVYSLRGLGYPLYAYGLLTWIMYVAAPEKKSAGAGWFWFAYALGAQILGSWVASLFLPVVGEVTTLWIGLAMATVGGLLGLTMIRLPFVTSGSGTLPEVLTSLRQGLSIAWRVPAVGLGGIVKIINLTGLMAFQVFYAAYLAEQTGMPVSRAILTFTILGVFSMIGNLGWGVLGDYLGWRTTVQWFASTLCVVAVLYLFYVPQVVGPNLVAIGVGGAIFGIGLSAYVPLTALMAGLAPGETGSALSIVNLGSGLAAVAGPGVATVLLSLAGFTGVVWCIAALYVVSFVLMFFIRLPGDARTLTAPARSAPAASRSLAA